MLLSFLISNPVLGTITLISLILAITVHEFAHAWVANQKGDPTAKATGRLTLNPFAHLDPVGTLFLILAGFGWGKPVPVDPFNLSDPEKDLALISIAGPLTNLLAAILGAVVYHLLFGHQGILTTPLYIFIYINLILAYFNLLPLYPLDGSKIWSLLLPPELSEELTYFSKEYGLLLLVLGLLPIINGQSLISLILNPLIQTSLNLLLH